jgi:excisionase family DNA binding protein
LERTQCGVRNDTLFDKNVREFPPLLDAKEAAAILGISVKTVYLWAKTYRLPSIHLGGRVKFKPDDIAAIYVGRRNL